VLRVVAQADSMVWAPATIQGTKHQDSEMRRTAGCEHCAKFTPIDSAGMDVTEAG